MNEIIHSIRMGPINSNDSEFLFTYVDIIMTLLSLLSLHDIIDIFCEYFNRSISMSE